MSVSLAEFQKLQKQLSDYKNHAQALQKQLNDSNTNGTAQTETIAGCRAALARLRANLRELSDKKAQAEKEKMAAQVFAKELQETLFTEESNKRAAEEKHRLAEGEKKQKKEELEAAKKELQAQQDSFARLQAQYKEAQKQNKEELEAGKKELEEQQAQHEEAQKKKKEELEVAKKDLREQQDSFALLRAQHENAQMLLESREQIVVAREQTADELKKLLEFFGKETDNEQRNGGNARQNIASNVENNKDEEERSHLRLQDIKAIWIAVLEDSKYRVTTVPFSASRLEHVLQEVKPFLSLAELSALQCRQENRQLFPWVDGDEVAYLKRVHSQETPIYRLWNWQFEALFPDPSKSKRGVFNFERRRNTFMKECVDVVWKIDKQTFLCHVREGHSYIAASFVKLDRVPDKTFRQRSGGLRVLSDGEVVFKALEKIFAEKSDSNPSIYDYPTLGKMLDVDITLKDAENALQQFKQQYGEQAEQDKEEKKQEKKDIAEPKAATQSRNSGVKRTHKVPSRFSPADDVDDSEFSDFDDDDNEEDDEEDFDDDDDEDYVDKAQKREEEEEEDLDTDDDDAKVSRKKQKKN